MKLIPIAYDTRQIMKMNSSLRGRKVLGYSSTTAVMKPSKVQNCESKPNMTIIRKNNTDHSGDTGNCRTADGYARKARPGPDVATSSICLPYENIENETI